MLLIYLPNRQGSPWNCIRQISRLNHRRHNVWRPSSLAYLRPEIRRKIIWDSRIEAFKYSYKFGIALSASSILLLVIVENPFDLLISLAYFISDPCDSALSWSLSCPAWYRQECRIKSTGKRIPSTSWSLLISRVSAYLQRNLSVLSFTTIPLLIISFLSSLILKPSFSFV